MITCPNCYTRRCLHFLGVGGPTETEVGERVVCAAYPRGIPRDIAYGGNLHLTSEPGDNGITYERKAEEPRP